MKIRTNTKDGFPVITDDAGKIVSYAEGIRAIRKDFNMSPEGFAELVGVGERCVRKWEAGSMPSARPLLALKVHLLRVNRRERQATAKKPRHPTQEANPGDAQNGQS